MKTKLSLKDRLHLFDLECEKQKEQQEHFSRSMDQSSSRSKMPKRDKPVGQFTCQFCCEKSSAWHEFLRHSLKAHSFCLYCKIQVPDCGIHSVFDHLLDYHCEYAQENEVFLKTNIVKMDAEEYKNSVSIETELKIGLRKKIKLGEMKKNLLAKEEENAKLKSDLNALTIDCQRLQKENKELHLENISFDWTISQRFRRKIRIFAQSMRSFWCSMLTRSNMKKSRKNP